MISLANYFQNRLTRSNAQFYFVGDLRDENTGVHLKGRNENPKKQWQSCVGLRNQSMIIYYLLLLIFFGLVFPTTAQGQGDNSGFWGITLGFEVGLQVGGNELRGIVFFFFSAMSLGYLQTSFLSDQLTVTMSLHSCMSRICLTLSQSNLQLII